MKTTITFDLPEEKEEHLQALNAGNYYTAISNYSQLLKEAMDSDTKEAEHAKWAYDELIGSLKESGMLELFDVR